MFHLSKPDQVGILGQWTFKVNVDAWFIAYARLYEDLDEGAKKRFLPNKEAYICQSASYFPKGKRPDPDVLSFVECCTLSAWDKLEEWASVPEYSPVANP